MTQGHHIASAFDRDLEAVQALIMKMGGLVEEAILQAGKSLQARDPELAQSVRDGDKAVDALQEQLHEEAARVIALRAPTAIDLRTILSVYQISSNLERIGDYCKNIAKRTQVLNEMDPINSIAAALNRMSRDVRVMLKDVLDAYVGRDVLMARSVIARDAEIDQMYNSLFRELLTYMLEDQQTITACMHLHFIAKNIERMGDHVTSIAEQVIYMVTGEKPEEDRQKGDKTSSDLALSLQQAR